MAYNQLKTIFINYSHIHNNGGLCKMEKYLALRDSILAYMQAIKIYHEKKCPSNPFHNKKIQLISHILKEINTAVYDKATALLADDTPKKDHQILLLTLFSVQLSEWVFPLVTMLVDIADHTSLQLQQFFNLSNVLNSKKVEQLKNEILKSKTPEPSTTIEEINKLSKLLMEIEGKEFKEWKELINLKATFNYHQTLIDESAKEQNKQSLKTQQHRLHLYKELLINKVQSHKKILQLKIKNNVALYNLLCQVANNTPFQEEKLGPFQHLIALKKKLVGENTLLLKSAAHLELNSTIEEKQNSSVNWQAVWSHLTKKEELQAEAEMKAVKQTEQNECKLLEDEMERLKDNFEKFHDVEQMINFIDSLAVTPSKIYNFLYDQVHSSILFLEEEEIVRNMLSTSYDYKPSSIAHSLEPPSNFDPLNSVLDCLEDREILTLAQCNRSYRETFLFKNLYARKKIEKLTTSHNLQLHNALHKYGMEHIKSILYLAPPSIMASKNELNNASKALHLLKYKQIQKESLLNNFNFPYINFDLQNNKSKFYLLDLYENNSQKKLTTEQAMIYLRHYLQNTYTQKNQKMHNIQTVYAPYFSFKNSQKQGNRWDLGLNILPSQLSFIPYLIPQVSIFHLFAVDNGFLLQDILQLTVVEAFIAVLLHDTNLQFINQHKDKLSTLYYELMMDNENEIDIIDLFPSLKEFIFQQPEYISYNNHKNFIKSFEEAIELGFKKQAVAEMCQNSPKNGMG